LTQEKGKSRLKQKAGFQDRSQKTTSDENQSGENLGLRKVGPGPKKKKGDQSVIRRIGRSLKGQVFLGPKRVGRIFTAARCLKKETKHNPEKETHNQKGGRRKRRQWKRRWERPHGYTQGP